MTDPAESQKLAAAQEAVKLVDDFLATYALDDVPAPTPSA